MQLLYHKYYAKTLNFRNIKNKIRSILILKSHNETNFFKFLMLNVRC